MLPSLVLSTKSSFQESYLTDVSAYSPSSHRCNAPSNANACYNPSKTGALNVGDDYVLNRLSTQVEVEHLRNAMHEFERVHLFRTNSGRSSNSAYISGIFELPIDNLVVARFIIVYLDSKCG